MSSPPDPAEVKVATQALRTEAGTWDHQGQELDALGAKVKDLALRRLEAGIFQLVVTPYNSIVNQIADRAGEGVQIMAQISAALHRVADTYEDEDAAGEHRIRGLY